MSMRNGNVLYTCMNDGTHLELSN